MENEEAQRFEREKERVCKRQRVIHALSCPSCTKKLFCSHSFGLAPNIHPQKAYHSRPSNRPVSNVHKTFPPIAPSLPLLAFRNATGAARLPFRYFPPTCMMMNLQNSGYRAYYDEKRLIRPTQQPVHVTHHYYDWAMAPAMPELIYVSDDSVGSTEVKCEKKEFDLNLRPPDVEEEVGADLKRKRTKLDLNLRPAESEGEVADLELKL